LISFSVKKNITFTGLVDNIEDYINASDVVICPLTSGGGTRFKILEALACGKVVVSTTIGAEGLESKRIGDSLILCDNWDDFVKIIISCLSKQNSNNNSQYMKNYSLEKISEPITNLLGE